MVSRKALEMSCHRSCDLFRVLHFKEMTDDLGIVGCLSGQSLHRIALCENFGLVHNLNLLEWLRNLVEGVR